MWIVSLMILGFIIIGVRIISISTSDYNEHHYSSPINLHNKRCRISDRNGNILSISIPTASIYANPQHITNPKFVAKQLSKIMTKVKYDELLSKLISKKKFIWIARHANPKQQYAINLLGIPGVYFMKDFHRVYPQSNLFSHITGMVDIDSRPISGIEMYLDMHPEIKNELILSLDIRIQNILHQELTKQVKKYKSEGGAGIIMDANSGEVLAMVSLPDFDPNKVTVNDQKSLFNRATLGLYEMGSTFKIFTMAAALDAEVVDLEEIFDVSQPLKIANHTLRDFYPYSSLSTKEVFAKSSNIGIAKIALRIGIQPLKKFLYKLGIISPLKIEIPEKASPIMPKKWTESTLTTVSYGYGLATSLMHMTQGAAAVVNGGTFFYATFLPNTTNKGFNVLTNENAKKMRELLHAAVTNGTGKKAKVNGYDVGGKTGSAEKITNGSYDKNRNISSFIGIFPTIEARYVIAIMIDEPNYKLKTQKTGGAVAAPVAATVIKKIAPILNMPPQSQSNKKI